MIDFIINLNTNKSPEEAQIMVDFIQDLPDQFASQGVKYYLIEAGIYSYYNHYFVQVRKLMTDIQEDIRARLVQVFKTVFLKSIQDGIDKRGICALFTCLSNLPMDFYTILKLMGKSSGQYCIFYSSSEHSEFYSKFLQEFYNKSPDYTYDNTSSNCVSIPNDLNLFGSPPILVGLHVDRLVDLISKINFY